MEEDDQKELQLLPAPQSVPSSSSSHIMSSRPLDNSSSIIRYRSKGNINGSDHRHHLDLQLSISLRPIHDIDDDDDEDDEDEDVAAGTTGCVEALKWQAAEQIRLAAMEKAYAERVRELTRREMELAQSEFARARHVWERAREEVERAERMKERATTATATTTTTTSGSTCMEITCQSCRQRFRP
ncbi:hypothetical protein L484_005518 [Morus notabilis]|uniref:Protein SHOOT GRAVITROPISM 5 n=1 Tax=Morus notabilis TaxID=981085 RepID=W9RY85_9ROSA|nr:uncharacterized protein LOC21388982 [Morus notabilis]EXB98029.1 hypothetical protein L484_005518 [Morus notabilis]